MKDKQILSPRELGYNLDLFLSGKENIFCVLNTFRKLFQSFLSRNSIPPYVFSLPSSARAVQLVLWPPWHLVHFSYHVQGQKSAKADNGDGIIGSLLEAGTQLSSLQDMLVSLQKQDPPIDLCFEMLEA